MSAHIVSPRLYLAVFAALLILTFATTAAAGVDMGPLNVVVALVIALVKALLVVVIFMHVRWSPKLIWLVAGAGFLWLAILLALTLTDYYSRRWYPVPQGI